MTDACETPPLKSVLDNQGKSSDFRSVCNIVMTAVGLGILELPPLVGEVGYINFAILMTVVCLSALLMTHIFYKSMLLTPYNNSYAAVSEAALGLSGKVIGLGVVQLSLIGINATLLVLLGNTMNRIAPITSMALNESRIVWVTIGCALAQPFIWIKRLSDIGMFSAAG